VRRGGEKDGRSEPSWNTEGRTRIARRFQRPSGRPSPGDPNSHHLVAASLKLVRDLLNRHVVARLAKVGDDAVRVRRLPATECKQRRDSNLARDATQLANRQLVKALAQLTTVKKEEMRAECQVERRVVEHKRLKFALDLIAVAPCRNRSRPERPHRGHAHLSKLLERSNRASDEFAGVLPRFLEDLIVGG
jgi:hypothetical protein